MIEHDDEVFDKRKALQTHKHYLESRHKELNARIEIHNKVLTEMTEDKTKLEKLITNIDIIMDNTTKE